MKAHPFLWFALMVVGFITVGCAPYTETRTIREGPVLQQREVVK